MDDSAAGAASLTRREGWIAALLALLLGAVVVGNAVWDDAGVYFATDTATVQAPWSAAAAPRNAELSDQGTAFYPHYLRISERWRAGEVPLWNPDLYAGVPLAANPQWGAYDPQVLALVALEAVGGRELFDRGFAWLALLRVAAATLGAYLLARRLGTGPAGAALAGTGFGLSGSLVLWLGYSLAHVTPLLPWVLLGLEGLRGPRPVRALLGTALALALAIYGGHPESSFFVGSAAGLWALAILDADRRAGVMGLAALAFGVALAGPVLLPFVEYLEHSGALVAHELARAGQPATPDLVSLGALLLFAWLVWNLREPRGARPGMALVLGVAGAALVFLLTRRGLTLDFRATSGNFIEGGSAWLAFPVFVVALVGLLRGPATARHGVLVPALAAASLLLTLGTPGVLELWRWVPLAGLAAPARAACVSALFVPLLAGMALERMDTRSRHAAVLMALFVLVLGTSFAAKRGLPVELARLDPPDEVLVYRELPPAEVGESPAHLRGVLRGGLELDAVTLAFEPLDDEGRTRSGAAFRISGELSDEDDSGSRAFDFGQLDLTLLPPGNWRLRLELLRGGEPFASRNAALVHAGGGLQWSGLQLGVAALTLAWLLALGVLRERAGPVSLLASPLVAVALALLAGLWFARGWNPTVPRAEHFATSRTEAYLAAHHPGERLVAEVGILPGDTALLAGLSTIDGYDALDVASFDGYRAAALLPGKNPLLDWNARGMDTTSPAFRLLGVRLMLLHEDRAPEGWRKVAGPGHPEHDTEVHVFEAERALPRAFCVAELVPREAALADLGSFDPERVAFVEDEFTVELATPMSTFEVRPIERAPERLVYDVEVDGDALFVVTEQHFPGWRARVDGEERELLRTNSIFRGVRLGAGEHRVEFEYRPASHVRGKLLALLGLLGLASGVTILCFARNRGAKP